VWVVDPGDFFQVFDWLTINRKFVKGIVVTHSHYDHIYGINALYEQFPQLKLFCSFYAYEGMLSEKLNGSRYHDAPYIVNVGNQVCIVKEGDLIVLWQGIDMTVYETPGHSRDCLSFATGLNLFTGDALIPGHKVITRMKFGDEQLAVQSLNRIWSMFSYDTRIYPGHEKDCLLAELTIDNTFVGYK
jgi:glyoxylase-like metal-dependent hydrolase (beta-lactamase superfamily II)